MTALRAIEEPPDDLELIGEMSWIEPEDRGSAVLSELGGVEYVEDLVRPGRIVVVGAVEGTGKTYAIDGELAIRIATAGGSFAGTWATVQTGSVLVLSEQHPDDDYGNETRILTALGLDRTALTGCYYRLPLMTAAGGPPALTVDGWRSWITSWMRDHKIIALIIDTATGASQVDPWGQAIQGVYANLRMMLVEYPALSIVLVVHLKKATAGGKRSIGDILGEWGRWNDITVMLEPSGRTKTKISTHKRIRHPREIVATKADGLLIDPLDLDDAKGPKVPLEDVVAAIEAAPGSSIGVLAAGLKVSKSTAAKYVDEAESQGLATRVPMGSGKGFRVYPAEKSLDGPPSNHPTPSNESARRSLDGEVDGPDRGTVQPSTHPIRVDGPSTGRSPSIVPDPDGYGPGAWDIDPEPMA